MAEARIDKWLWASRIFKTRTIAAEACKKGRVSINGTQVKPSRMTPEQYELLEMSRISGFVDRARGTGRPTKKDRRSMEEFITPEYFGDDDFDFEFDFEEQE